MQLQRKILALLEGGALWRTQDVRDALGLPNWRDGMSERLDVSSALWGLLHAGMIARRGHYWEALDVP